MKKEICKLLDISDVSYYRWKSDRPIILFLEKYFNKSEISEFLESAKIEKLELIKDFSLEELKLKLSVKSENEDFLYSNVLFKLKSLRDAEKAVLYAAVKLDSPFSKESLLNSISNISSYKINQNKVVKAFLWKKFDNKFEEKFIADKNKTSLKLFVSNFISSDEIKIFLDKPDFESL